MNLQLLIWEQGWQTAGWTMVYFLALGALVVLLAAPLRWLLRGADPTFRYTTSLAVFAALALMPVGIALWLSPPLTEFSPAPAPQTTDLAITPLETDSPATLLQAPAPLPSSEPAEPRATWTAAEAVEYFPWVWLAGTPLTFLLLTTGLIGAERLRRANQIVSEGPVPEAAERLRAALGVGRRVTVAVCDHLATPLMVGIVRPPILLAPAALTGWSADQLEMVLLHELAHVRRWDNLVNLLQRVVESLLFFHPAVWIVSRWVRRDREDCCDAVVVARTAKPQAYAELLVALASPSHPLAGLALARHPLAGRIRRILHLEDETMLVPRNTLVAITTSLLAIVLAVSCYNLRHTEAEEVTTNETDSTNQEIDNSVVDKVIEPGKTMVQFFPHPTAPEVVSEAVKKLNRIGHNVTARPTEHGTALLIEDGVLQSQTSPGIRKSSTVRFNGTPQQDESATLFYDDIPFDGWRHFWKTELKTENRIECIKALAAFGRAGKGKEAVEAILEVVKEYDWTFISGTPLGRLKMAAIEAMGGTDHDQGVRAISTDDWLPVLTKEVLAGNKRIIAFAGYVYPEAWIKAIRASDEEAIQRMNQALRDMGPLAVPYLLPHLLRSEVMDRAVVDADGNVHSQKTESNMAAADVLREITGSDETAIKHLESLVGDITSRPVPKWEKEQAKLTLQRLKSRQEQQPRGLSRVPK